MNSARTTLPLLLLIACVGCGDPEPRDTPEQEEVTTYHNTIRPLIEDRCQGCHTEGGVAPFALDSWASIEPLAGAIVQSVATGSMPPWPADPECHSFKDEVRLDDEEIALFLKWQEAGFPEGDPDTYVAPAPRDAIDPGPPQLTLDAGVDYLPDPDQPDDYRCIPLAHEFPTDTFIKAADVLPGNKSVVHHVLLYLVRPQHVGTLERLDQHAEGLGYPCFGASNIGNNEVITGWVPGGNAHVYPENAAFMIPAGSRIVMQMHYNTAGVRDAAAPPSDRTRVALWTLPEGEVPERLLFMPLFVNPDIYIPPDAVDHVERRRFGIPFNGLIHGQIPHMHNLGTSIRVTHGRGDNDANSSCLVSIPDWDFQWQRTYFHRDDDPTEVKAGDWIDLECVYDNSVEAQPVVNGEKLEPTHVYFGERTTDEMCLTFLMASVPYSGGGVGTCAGLEGCINACPPGDGACASTCTFGSGTECLGCFFGNMTDCAIEHCAAEALAFDRCNRSCGDLWGCHTNECGEPFNALWACLEGPVTAGACNESFAACGVAF